MRKNEQINVTEWSYRERIETVINMVNWLTHDTPIEQFGPPDIAILTRDFCRTFHQIAQIVSLPKGNLREEYRKAVVGTDAEWSRFCERLPAKLWRGWTDIDPRPIAWRKPRISFGLDIDEEGVKPDGYDIVQILVEVGADIKRLRECRKCQRLFWASRIEKSGGPYGCSPRCNNALRQRDFKASKKH